MKLRKKPTHKRVRVTYDMAEFMAAKPTLGPRVLHLDIETSLMRVWCFSLHQQYISMDDIVTDWNILSFCAKWHGTGPAIYQSLRTQRNPTNDFKLCKSLHRMLSEADVVVAHNGKRFDLKKIRARMAHNRMPPFPDVRIIDTFLESRRVFGFTSQKLAYLTQHFGEDGMRKNAHGKFPGKKLWIECQSGNQQAWDEMEKYNIPDVLSMEGAYMELRPWFQGAQSLAVFQAPHDGRTCPNCGGHDHEKRGLRHTQVGIYQRYQCTTLGKDGRVCGAWYRGREQMLSKAERRHIGIN